MLAVGHDTRSNHALHVTSYDDDDDDDVWYVRHPRAAIEIVQQSAIYIPFYLEAA